MDIMNVESTDQTKSYTYCLDNIHRVEFIIGGQRFCYHKEGLVDMVKQDNHIKNKEERPNVQKQIDDLETKFQTILKEHHEQIYDLSNRLKFIEAKLRKLTTIFTRGDVV
jgi:hypothetical protein